MKKGFKTHYSGRLAIRRGESVTLISAGFGACATGKAAWKIRERGNSTRDPAQVTCRRCNFLMALAAVGDALRKNQPA